MRVKPMGILLMMLAGWINRHQQDVIVYLKEENKILREKLGAKRISEEVEQFIIQIARKNKTWGSRRIKGQLKYLGHKVCHATINNVLKRNGLTPGPDRARETHWSEFLRSYWESLAAIDFFTTEIYTLSGLTRYMVLVSIDYVEIGM
jgi:hypothetical protein